MPSPLTDPAKLSPEAFAHFAQCITARLGIRMAAGKQCMLQSRLQRRLRDLQLASLDEYQAYLFARPEDDPEWTEFINVVTTNKTDFFREPQHFEILRHRVLAELDATPREPWLCKLWCAGCSSGEEVYTLAMVLAEHAAERPGFDFRILGTDISTRVLEKARLGVYDEVRIEPLTLVQRRQFLLRHRQAGTGLVRIRPELRSRTTFARLNFMDADYPVNERFPVIFFRNVLIYFDKPTQAAVLRKLCRHLRPHGYLFVGHSESLAGLDVPLASVGGSVYRRLP